MQDARDQKNPKGDHDFMWILIALHEWCQNQDPKFLDSHLSRTLRARIKSIGKFIYFPEDDRFALTKITRKRKKRGV